MLIVMTGLPATGKSTVARGLAARLDAVIVSKDIVRTAAFPSSAIDYSPEQDDLCMEMLYQAVGYVLGKWPGRNVIIDGRTYSQRRHVERLFEIAARLRVTPQFIECVCDEAVARERLDAADRTSAHPARNRDFELYRAVRAKAQPLEQPRLTIDTGQLDLAQALARCVEYLNRSTSSA